MKRLGRVDDSVWNSSVWDQMRDSSWARGWGHAKNQVNDRVKDRLRARGVPL